MSSGTPRITVVIAVRNGEGTLQRALESVFAQTYPSVEIVVIDGASTDGTTAILERHGDRIAYWESERDRGIYHAWNKALDHVAGDWILFLGADDELAGSTVFADLAPDLAGLPSSTRVAYGELDIVRDENVIRREGMPWKVAGPEFRTRMSLPHTAALHRRELFAAVGKFDESYRIAGDYELLLRELPEHDAAFIPGVLVRMGAGGVSDRADRRTSRLREFERARRAHGHTRAPEGIGPAVVRGRVRDGLRRVGGPGAEAAFVAAYRRLVDPVRGSRAGGPSPSATGSSSRTGSPPPPGREPQPPPTDEDPE